MEVFGGELPERRHEDGGGDHVRGIVAAGLTQYRAYSTDEVMALLQQGNQNRTTESTRANETSSRSHAILQVVVEYQVRDAAMNIIKKMGKLSAIDLAGSERALATDQRTVRSLEGANQYKLQRIEESKLSFSVTSTNCKETSFWDITTANSPSVTTLNGRKTRSHVISETTAHPSVLLQVSCFLFS
ncbi:Kinesin-like protein KIN-8A [Glycine soja]